MFAYTRTTMIPRFVKLFASLCLFLAFVMLISSCKNDEPYSGLSDASIIGAWRLDTMGAVDKSTIIVNQDKGFFFNGKHLDLSFLEDHTISSTGYCYNLGGDYIIRENNTLQISARRTNANEILPSSQWETMLLYALNHAVRYEIKENRLFIFYENGAWRAQFSKR